jgi:hypothetical protein
MVAIVVASPGNPALAVPRAPERDDRVLQPAVFDLTDRARTIGLHLDVQN